MIKAHTYSIITIIIVTRQELYVISIFVISKHLQDWNVFVSDKSFEEGLLWLERQVALRQAQLRGFFTYTDLAAACNAALLGDAVRAAAAAAAASAAGLLALVASALVVSQACLPPLRPSHPLSAALDTTTFDHNYQNELPINLSNATVDIQTYTLSDDSVTNNLRCCTKWLKYQEESEPKKTWYDGVITYDWKFEPWWSRTSVLNWLYQSSLINPMQRWLEKMNQYIDFIKKDMGYMKGSSVEKCNGYNRLGERQCVRQWLNLSKLSVFVASVSDR